MPAKKAETAAAPKSTAGAMRSTEIDSAAIEEANVRSWIARVNLAPVVDEQMPPATIRATLGIFWTNPTYDVLYDVIVNGSRISGSDVRYNNIGKDGKVIRGVNLVRNQDNRIDIAIGPLCQ